MANPISPVSPHSENDSKSSTVPFHASCPQCHHLFNHVDIVVPVGPNEAVDILCPICGRLHCRLGRASTQDTILSQETVHPSSLVVESPSTRSALSSPRNGNAGPGLQSPPETPDNDRRENRQPLSDNNTSQRRGSTSHPPKIQIDTPTPTPTPLGRKRKVELTSPTSFGRAKSALGRAFRSIKKPRFFSRRGEGGESQQSPLPVDSDFQEPRRPTTAPAMAERLLTAVPDPRPRRPSFEDPKTIKRRFRTGLSEAQHLGCQCDKTCPWHAPLKPIFPDRLPHSSLNGLYESSQYTTGSCPRQLPTNCTIVPELSIPSERSLSLQEASASPTSSLEIVPTHASAGPSQSRSSMLIGARASSTHLSSHLPHEETTAETPDLTYGSSASSTDSHTARHAHATLRPRTPLLQTNLDLPGRESEADEGDGDLTPTQLPRRQSPASPEDFHGVGGWAHSEERH